MIYLVQRPVCQKHCSRGEKKVGSLFWSMCLINWLSDQPEKITISDKSVNVHNFLKKQIDIISNIRVCVAIINSYYHHSKYFFLSKSESLPWCSFFFFSHTHTHTHTHCILFLQEINRLTPSIVHGWPQQKQQWLQLPNMKHTHTWWTCCSF